MSCIQTLAGLTRDCEPNMGGIKAVYLANYDDVTATTVSSDKITAITMATSKKFKAYYFRPGTGSMTSMLNKNNETGNAYWGTDVVLSFSRMETVKRIEMNAIAVAPLAVMVLDNNGKYWYLGYDHEVLASAGDINTGTAFGDKNGYGMTLHDDCQVAPYEVDADAAEAVIG